MLKEPEHIIADGKAAERLLNDEVFQAACDAVEKKSVETWKTSPPTAAAVREAEYYTLQALARIRHELEVIQGDGAKVQHEVTIARQRQEMTRPARRN